MPVRPTNPNADRSHAGTGTILQRRRDRCAPPSDGTSLDLLMGRIAIGDLDALDEFYALTINRVRGVIRSVLRDAMGSEEIAQEVMLEVWRVSPRFDPRHGSAVGWVMSIARRRAIDCVRSEVARSLRDHRYHDTLAESRGEADRTGTDVVDLLDREALNRGLSGLPDHQRDAIASSFWNGQTHVEIAAMTETPLGTVKSNVRRGLAAMQRSLGSVAEFRGF